MESMARNALFLRPGKGDETMPELIALTQPDLLRRPVERRASTTARLSASPGNGIPRPKPRKFLAITLLLVGLSPILLAVLGILLTEGVELPEDYAKRNGHSLNGLVDH
jgi:hypothetical protein